MLGADIVEYKHLCNGSLVIFRTKDRAKNRCVNFMCVYVCLCVCTLDPPQDISIDPPRNVEVGASFNCSADANPPVSRYEWTRVSSGELLSIKQALVLTDSLAFG